MTVCGYKTKIAEEKVAFLLTIGGEDPIEIYNSFEFPTTEGEAIIMVMMLEAVMEKINAYFSPRKK